MPALAKGSKGGKKKGGGKKGAAAKIVPDPDAAYKSQLDDAHYVCKPSREKLRREYAALIDTAIKANTISAASSPGELYVAPTRVPLLRVPDIVRSLGLCATDQQMEQISCMVSQASNVDVAKEGAVEPEGPFPSSESSASIDALRQVLTELMQTHVLAYDPQVLARPDPRFPIRMSSVVYRVSERDLVSCFEAIWEVTGKKSTVRRDQSEVRCFTVRELEAVMTEVQKSGTVALPLSRKELDDLYFFIKAEEDDVIAEDTFLNCLTDVK